MEVSEDLGMRTVMEDLKDLGMYPLARVALNRSMSWAMNLDGKLLSSSLPMLLLPGVRFLRCWMAYWRSVKSIRPIRGELLSRRE